MQIAKQINDSIVLTDTDAEFPNVSGINDAYLSDRACFKVYAHRDHDADTQKLVTVPVYIDGPNAYTVRVQALSAEELAAKLASRQDAVWTKIKAERDRRIQANGYKVGAKWYHSDTFSRSQQMGLCMAGAGIPPGLQWKTMDGSFITMTPTLAQQIFGAAMLSDVAIFAKAESLRVQMQAAADPASIDTLVGWPQGFGE